MAWNHYTRFYDSTLLFYSPLSLIGLGQHCSEHSFHLTITFWHEQQSLQHILPVLLCNFTDNHTRQWNWSGDRTTWDAVWKPWDVITATIRKITFIRTDIIQSGKPFHSIWTLPKNSFMWVTSSLWIHFLVYRVTHIKSLDCFLKYVPQTCKFHETGSLLHSWFI